MDIFIREHIKTLKNPLDNEIKKVFFVWVVSVREENLVGPCFYDKRKFTKGEAIMDFVKHHFIEKDDNAKV